MNLYTVNYSYGYNKEIRSCAVVATNAAKAIEGAKFVMRSRHAEEKEITSLTMTCLVDRVAK